MKKSLTAILIALAVAPAFAAEVPQPSAKDPRVRYVNYDKDQVTVVTVRRGVVTRILLGDDERIVVSAAGFGGDCKASVSGVQPEWCIRADQDTNEIWIKPQDGATHNNIEVRTTKRNYSIEFKVLPDAPVGAKGKRLVEEPMYRVVYRHPVPIAMQANLTAAELQAQEAAMRAARDKARLADLLKNSGPVPRNWKYSMKVNKGSADIAPSAVFDDGRFTYMQFPGAREIPTVFYIDKTGLEGKANFHMDTERELVVVERISPRFVLRLGKAAVGIWNDGFNSNGRAALDGTTVEGVKRTIKAENDE